jgi:molybdate transport system substrate-binding protein
LEQAAIRAISAPTFKYLFEKLRPHFEASTGYKLVIEFGWFSLLKGRIDAEDFDVAISAGATTDYLAKQGRTVPSTRVEFSRAGIGMGVSAGAPKPDIKSDDALKRALLNAKSISIPPPASTTGAYLLTLFERLGVAGEIKSKLQITESGDHTVKAVAAGRAEIGITLINEFVPVPGVEIVGSLPSELQNYVVGTAAVGSTARDPRAAESLVKYLGTTTALDLIKADGLEPILPR